CGFSDQSSFCNFFKRHTGLTPSEYIRSLLPPKAED
ncbi:MAG: helix-turn-helix domain-containing protein, partial [Sphingobacterium sp.]